MNRSALMSLALAASALPGCPSPPAPNYLFSISGGPGDFATGTRSDRIYFYWLASGIDHATASEADAYFSEHLRVYSIESGQRVAGEVRLGFWTMDGTQLSEPMRVGNQQEGYSFIPAVPLDGWYIVALDIGPWRASGHAITTIAAPLEGDLMYMRLHVGPTPVWFETHVEPLDLEARGWPALVTPYVGVPLRAPTSNPFSLLVDGAVDPRCAESRDTEYGWWYWQCSSLPPESEMTVRLEDDTVVSPLSGIHSQTFRADAALRDNLLRIDPRFGIDVARGAP